MARRPRSLSELPGHLRVPILKRKDTERTKARLEAGLAGMEELRALREQQQQLIGDTMAKAGNRQRLQRRHSDNSLLTSRTSKMSRSAGQITPSGYHDAITSWTSASSLASISEEGDNASIRDFDKNSSQPIRTKQTTLINTYTNDRIDGSGVHIASFQETQSFQGSSSFSDSSTSDNINSEANKGYSSRQYSSLRSLEDPGYYPRPNDITQTQTGEVTNGHVSRNIRRSISFSCNPAYGYTSAALPNTRRNSTSMIHDLQSQEYCRPSSAHFQISSWKNKNGNQSRSPLSSLSNIQTTAKEMSVNSHCQNNVEKQSNAEKQNALLSRTQRQLSWDNLLKTMGISNSTSSLASLTDDQINDTEDCVFSSSENKDIRDKKRNLSDRISRQKVGRSLSFSCDNPFEYSRGRSRSYCQETVGNSTVEDVSIQAHRVSQTITHPHEIIQPIMRRASMQCEVVLTNSSVGKRVNPIQDVDINSVTSPGPVHAVMLQYTAREVNQTSVFANNSCPSTVSSTGNQSKEMQKPETDNYLTATFHNDSSDDRPVKNNTLSSNSQTNLDKDNRPTRHANNVSHRDSSSMDYCGYNENILLDEKHVKRKLFHRYQNTNHKHGGIDRSDRKDGPANITGASSENVDDNSKGCFNDVDNGNADILSKTSSCDIEHPTKSSLLCENCSEEVNERKSNPVFVTEAESSESVPASSGSSNRKLQVSPNRLQTKPCADHFHAGNLVSLTVSHVDEHLTNYEERHSLNYGENKKSEHNNTESQFLITDNTVDTNTDNQNMEINTGSSPPWNKNKENSIGHVMKHCPNVSKLRFSVSSSDASVISDEGYYSTGDTLGPISKCGSQCKYLLHKNPLNISQSTLCELDDDLGQGLDESERSIRDCKHEHEAVLGDSSLEKSKNQMQSGEEELKYDKVAVLEQGVSLMWNPESSTTRSNPKSLQRRVIASKSLKQTAV